MRWIGDDGGWFPVPAVMLAGLCVLASAGEQSSLMCISCVCSLHVCRMQFRDGDKGFKMTRNELFLKTLEVSSATVMFSIWHASSQWLRTLKL